MCPDRGKFEMAGGDEQEQTAGIAASKPDGARGNFDI